MATDPHTPPTSRSGGPRWWLWAVVAICWYATAAVRPLMEPDEGRYAEIPREMWISGDWVTPRLSGLKYFEKPPLQYWATAAAYSLFGANELTSRLFALTTAFLCLPLVYFFTLRLYASTTIATTAVLLLASNPVFVVIGQINLLDSAFALFLTAALFALSLLSESQRGSAPERKWALAMWVALALAVLTKGVAAVVLCGLTLSAYSIICRDLEPWRRLHWRWGLPLFTLIAMPWFVAVAMRNPEFLKFFFIHEHFSRFLTTTHARTGPWWYFVPLLCLAILPWAASITAALRDTIHPVAKNSTRTQRLLWTWCAVVTVFFSVSQSKLAPYILPIMPALAVAMASRVAVDARRYRKAAYALFALTLVGAVAIHYEPARRGVAILGASLWPAIVAVLLATLVVVCARRRRAEQQRERNDFGFAAVGLLTLSLLLLGYSQAIDTRSAKLLATSVRSNIGPATQIFSVGQYRQTLAPYLGRTPHVVNYQGELAFGQAQEASPAAFSLEHFLQQWPLHSNAVAIVDRRLYDNLGPARLPGLLLAFDGESVVLRPYRKSAARPAERTGR